jgi:hypothetical protein
VPEYSPTDPAILTFYILPVILVALFAWGCGRVYGVATPGGKRARPIRVARLVMLAGAAWMAIAWRVAASGVLRQWDAMPPPLFILVATLVAIACAIAFSPLGRRLAFGLPLWVLVAYQAFRLPLEIAMHRLATLGVMPPQMSYGWPGLGGVEGRNFDILTGATAIAVALLLRAGLVRRSLTLAWNAAGFLLLLNIVIIAMLSTPKFRYYGDDRLNVFVTYPPFVWLPTVMVLAALAGHLLIFRACLGRGNFADHVRDR